MKKQKNKRSFGRMIYWTGGILLVFVLLSAWTLSGIYARYASTGTVLDSARVASSGIGTLELIEHAVSDDYPKETSDEEPKETGEEEPKKNSGVYRLLEDEVKTGNEYLKVIPGVDIPKDPFVRVELFDPEVDYQLYIKVIKSDYFPETVTFELTDDWVEIDAVNGIYKYKTIFNAGKPLPKTEIHILKDDLLTVSEHYVGKDNKGNLQKFSLSFSAYLVQMD